MTSLLNATGYYSSAMISELEKSLMDQFDLSFAEAQKYVLEGRAQLGMARWEPPTPELTRICEQFCGLLKKEETENLSSTDESTSLEDDDGSVYFLQETNGDQHRPWEVDTTNEYKSRIAEGSRFLEPVPSDEDEHPSGLVSADVAQRQWNGVEEFSVNDDFSALWINEEEASFLPGLSRFRGNNDDESSMPAYSQHSLPRTRSSSCSVISKGNQSFISQEGKNSPSVASSAVYLSEDDDRSELKPQPSVASSAVYITSDNEEESAGGGSAVGSNSSSLHFAPRASVLEESTNEALATVVEEVRSVSGKSGAESSRNSSAEESVESYELASVFSIDSGTRRVKRDNNKPPEVIYLLRQYMTDYLDEKKKERKEAKKSQLSKAKNVQKQVPLSTVSSGGKSKSYPTGTTKSQVSSSHSSNQKLSQASVCDQSRTCSVVSLSHKSQAVSFISRGNKSQSSVQTAGAKNVIIRDGAKPSKKMNNCNESNLTAAISVDAVPQQLRSRSFFRLKAKMKPKKDHKDIEVVSPVGVTEVHRISSKQRTKQTSKRTVQSTFTPPACLYIPDETSMTDVCNTDFPVKEISFVSGNGEENLLSL